MIIDTHTHVYQPQFDSDRSEMMDRARQAGVEKILLPAIDSSTHDRMLQMEEEYGHCHSMMGLHPCSVNDEWESELAVVKEWLDKRSFIAIGEIGLDFYWDKTFTQQQYAAFELQMEWALQRNLPVVIHTRSAMQETIDLVKPFAEKGLRGVFHCFGESYAMAKQIMDLGFLLGIGGVVTYKKSGLDETLKQVPLSALVLETDAPYLAPVPFRGKRNEVAYLTYIVERLADIYQVSTAAVEEQTAANAVAMFHLPG